MRLGSQPACLAGETGSIPVRGAGVNGLEVMAARKCRRCDLCKPLSSFDLTGNGYPRRICKACRAAAYRVTHRTEINARVAQQRKLNRATTILRDSRSTDSKNGLADNDLELTLIEALIAQPCTYCGSTEVQMTLDRKDNGKAHRRDNVVPCCFRCNMIRGAMPYEAWLCFVPVLREVVKKGLLGTWMVEPFALKQRIPVERVRQKAAPCRGPGRVQITCIRCSAHVVKRSGDVRNNRRKGHAGPFCSRTCASVWTWAQRQVHVADVEQRVG